MNTCLILRYTGHHMIIKLKLSLNKRNQIPIISIVCIFSFINFNKNKKTCKKERLRYLTITTKTFKEKNSVVVLSVRQLFNTYFSFERLLSLKIKMSLLLQSAITMNNQLVRYNHWNSLNQEKITIAFGFDFIWQWRLRLCVRFDIIHNGFEYNMK